MKLPSGAPRGMKRVFLQVAPMVEGPWLALAASLRGFWLQLQVYCSAQENSGRMVGAKQWPSQQWLFTLGKGGNRHVIDQLVAAKVAAWDGDDLIVAGYDREAEEGYKRKRESGRLGGNVSAQRKAARDAEGGAGIGPGTSEPSSDGGGNTAGSAVEDGGEEASRAGAGSAETGAGRSGQVQRGRAPSALDSSLFAIPKNSDEAITLFVRRYEQELGVVYKPDAADTMGMRAHWDRLEPDELPDRMSSYLKSDPAGASVTGFLGWHFGADWQQQARGKSRS